MGALGAVLASRRLLCRSLRLAAREVLIRGAYWGMVTTLIWVVRIDDDDPSRGSTLFIVGLGAVVGLVGGLAGRFLSPAERAFARATKALRAGKRNMAYEALLEYVRDADKDPLRAARLPAARAFMDGQTDTLDLSLELVAAPAPTGKGTEMEAASAPAGRGTEMEAAGKPPMQGSKRG